MGSKVSSSLNNFHLYTRLELAVSAERGIGNLLSFPICLESALIKTAQGMQLFNGGCKLISVPTGTEFGK